MYVRAEMVVAMAIDDALAAAIGCDDASVVAAIVFVTTVPATEAIVIVDVPRRRGPMMAAVAIDYCDDDRPVVANDCCGAFCDPLIDCCGDVDRANDCDDVRDPWTNVYCCAPYDPWNVFVVHGGHLLALCLRRRHHEIYAMTTILSVVVQVMNDPCAMMMSIQCLWMRSCSDSNSKINYKCSEV